MDKQRNTILIVDDEALSIAALTHILSPLYTVYVAKDGAGAIESAKRLHPDVILLDVVMPDIDGFGVLATLKMQDDTKDIPVIFVTGLGQESDEEKGLSLGAVDYIVKPFNQTIVRLRVQCQMQVQNQMQRIRHLSITDALTGVANRMHFNDKINQEWVRAVRDKLPLSILLLDIDDFKKINDTYGHLSGDKVLKTIAELVKAMLQRSMDLMARWGGEEFAVLLPNTDLEGAAYVAERIRATVEEQDYQLAENSPTVTVSIGLNCIVPHQESTVFDFVSSADEALYKAKGEGKNRVKAAYGSS